MRCTCVHLRAASRSLHHAGGIAYVASSFAILLFTVGVRQAKPRLPGVGQQCIELQLRTGNNCIGIEIKEVVAGSGRSANGANTFWSASQEVVVFLVVDIAIQLDATVGKSAFESKLKGIR